MLPEFRNEPILDFSLETNRKEQTEALELVQRRLGREYDLIIGSERVKAPKKFTSINPSSKSEVIGVFKEGTPEHACLAIETCFEAFHTRNRLPAQERPCLLLSPAYVL